MCLNFSARSQNVYMVLVIQNDASIGALKDRAIIRNLGHTLDSLMPSVRVFVNILDSQEATKEVLEGVVSGIPLTSEDVLWLYYSGHGQNYDTWPMTHEQEIP